MNKSLVCPYCRDPEDGMVICLECRVDAWCDAEMDDNDFLVAGNLAEVDDDASPDWWRCPECLMDFDSEQLRRAISWLGSSPL